MLYLKLLFAADGTENFGKAIRMMYLFGHFGKGQKATKKFNSLDRRNFKKWKKLNRKEFNEYLKVARI